MDEEKTVGGPARSRTGRRIGLVAIAAAVIGVAAVYGIGRTSRNGESSCPLAASTAARLAPFAKGELAALNVAASPSRLQPLAFKRPNGSDTTLAAFAGKTVLLNLWATWCPPCREEMPALDRLQGELGSPTFEVVSVNIDTRNTERAPAFLDGIGVKRLARYSDPTAKLFGDLKGAGLAFGMPTTLLVDAEGCLLASLAGPANWSSPDATALLHAALAPDKQ
jgi:thiol-disulfide isomerase/thioredoxin